MDGASTTARDRTHFLGCRFVGLDDRAARIPKPAVRAKASGEGSRDEETSDEVSSGEGRDETDPRPDVQSADLGGVGLRTSEVQGVDLRGAGVYAFKTVLAKRVLETVEIMNGRA